MNMKLLEDTIKEYRSAFVAFKKQRLKYLDLHYVPEIIKEKRIVRHNNFARDEHTVYLRDVWWDKDKVVHNAPVVGTLFKSVSLQVALEHILETQRLLFANDLIFDGI